VAKVYWEDDMVGFTTAFDACSDDGGSSTVTEHKSGRIFGTTPLTEYKLLDLWDSSIQESAGSVLDLDILFKR